MFIFGHAGLSLLAMASYRAVRREPRPWGHAEQCFLVLAFSLLPDLLDKPIALWLMPQAPSTRLFGHTLVFWVLLMVSLRAFKPGWMIYGWVSFLHLLLDEMWMSPHTLWFPFLGWHMDPSRIPALTLWELLHRTIDHYRSHWNLLIPELLGMGVMGYAGVRIGSTFRAREWGPRVRPPR